MDIERELFIEAMGDECETRWIPEVQQFSSTTTQAMWRTWQAARPQGGEPDWWQADNGCMLFETPEQALAFHPYATPRPLYRHPPTSAVPEDLRDAIRSELINTPELENFSEAIRLEALHQRERWGSDHDDGKEPADWLWLVAYLATKATQAARYGDHEKYIHHIITCGAACLNWHANATGADTSMRVGPPDPTIPKMEEQA